MRLSFINPQSTCGC